MAGAFTAYLHYVAMTVIAVILVVEHMLCAPGLTGGRIRLDGRHPVPSLARPASGSPRRT